MNGETLLVDTDYFHAFPAPEDVFGRDVEQHCEYLLPLASVCLSRINPDWQGEVHFVLPIEPHDGVVGDDTKDHHTYLCRENWIGYRVSNNRYELACDFRFFLKADIDVRPRKNERQAQTLETLNSHYQKVRESFEESKRHFHENGSLHSRHARGHSRGYSPDDRVELVRHLGGVSLYGNWPGIGGFPLSQYPYIDANGDEWTKVLPRTEDGRDFAFIGSIPSWNYVRRNGSELHLFYDHQDGIALTTFDWS